MTLLPRAALAAHVIAGLNSGTSMIADLAPKDQTRTPTRGRVVGRQAPAGPVYPNVEKGTIGRSTREKRRKLAKKLGKK